MYDINPKAIIKVNKKKLQQINQQQQNGAIKNAINPKECIKTENNERKDVTNRKIKSKMIDLNPVTPIWT